MALLLLSWEKKDKENGMKWQTRENERVKREIRRGRRARRGGTGHRPWPGASVLGREDEARRSHERASGMEQGRKGRRRTGLGGIKRTGRKESSCMHASLEVRL